MVFWVNCPIIKVLIRILLRFWITKPVSSRKRRKKRRRWRTTTRYQVLWWNGFLRCHVRKLKNEQKQKRHNKNRCLGKKKKKRAMHGNTWTCYVQTKDALWAKTQSKLQYSYFINSHNPRVHENMIIMIESCEHKGVCPSRAGHAGEKVELPPRLGLGTILRLLG